MRISDWSSDVCSSDLATIWRSTKRGGDPEEEAVTESNATTYTSDRVFKAWLPWMVLSVCVFLWGIPQVKAWLDSLFTLALRSEERRVGKECVSTCRSRW